MSKTGDTMSNTLKVEKIAGYAAGDWEMAHFLATSQNDQTSIAVPDTDLIIAELMPLYYS